MKMSCSVSWAGAAAGALSSIASLWWIRLEGKLPLSLVSQMKIGVSVGKARVFHHPFSVFTTVRVSVAWRSSSMAWRPRARKRKHPLSCNEPPRVCMTLFEHPFLYPLTPLLCPSSTSRGKKDFETKLLLLILRRIYKVLRGERANRRTSNEMRCVPEKLVHVDEPGNEGKKHGLSLGENSSGTKPVLATVYHLWSSS